MKLSPDLIQQYQDQGMLFLPSYFSETEAKKWCEELSCLPANLPGTIMEQDGQTIRALHGIHAYSQVFQDLIRHPALLEPAQQILNSLVYLYQLKINMKAAFTGDLWPWHQDYAFWYAEDEMPEPKVVNIAIFLDEVNHFNGPLYLILGSHQDGLIQMEAKGLESNWQANFSANLKYTVDSKKVAQLAENKSLFAPVGSAGSVLFFHSNIVHSSPPNLSPYPRKIMIITYNSVENIPIPKKEPRPEFLVSRDYTPLHPLLAYSLS